MRWLNRLARTMLGAAFGAYLTIHAVAHAHPAPGWSKLIFVGAIVGVIGLLVSEPALRDRRRTLHVGRSAEGGVRIWREAPVKPLFTRQAAERAVADQEIEVGWRAIRVGGEVLDAYQQARRRVAAVREQWNDPSPWDNPEGDRAVQTAYAEALNDIKSRVGAAWSEVLSDLERLGAKPSDAYEISVNFTGLDSEANQVQALGRALLRKHGIDPDKDSGAESRRKGWWPFK